MTPVIKEYMKYTIEVLTWNGTEAVDIVVYDGVMYLGECSILAMEGIRAMVPPEHLEIYKDIVVIWRPDSETNCVCNPKEIEIPETEWAEWGE